MGDEEEYENCHQGAVNSIDLVVLFFSPEISIERLPNLFHFKILADLRFSLFFLILAYPLIPISLETSIESRVRQPLGSINVTFIPNTGKGVEDKINISWRNLSVANMFVSGE